MTCKRANQMRMREERIPNKILHIKRRENDQEEDPEPDGYTKLERIQKRDRDIGKKHKKTGNGRIKNYL